MQQEKLLQKTKKVLKKQKPILKSCYCQSQFSRTNNRCCKQVILATPFERNATLRTYQIFYQLNCKSSYIIYLLDCLKYQVQYVKKSETELKNIRLNNHRKAVTRKDSILASNHFDIEGQISDIFAKFIAIEQHNQTNLEKLTVPKRFKIREKISGS